MKRRVKEKEEKMRKSLKILFKGNKTGKKRKRRKKKEKKRRDGGLEGDKEEKKEKIRGWWYREIVGRLRICV